MLVDGVANDGTTANGEVQTSAEVKGTIDDKVSVDAGVKSADAAIETAKKNEKEDLKEVTAAIDADTKVLEADKAALEKVEAENVKPIAEKLVQKD